MKWLDDLIEIPLALLVGWDKDGYLIIGTIALVLFVIWYLIIR